MGNWWLFCKTSVEILSLQYRLKIIFRCFTSSEWFSVLGSILNRLQGLFGNKMPWLINNFYNSYRRARVSLGLVYQRPIKQLIHFNTTSVLGMSPKKIIKPSLEVYICKYYYNINYNNKNLETTYIPTSNIIIKWHVIVFKLWLLHW